MKNKILTLLVLVVLFSAACGGGTIQDGNVPDTDIYRDVIMTIPGEGTFWKFRDGSVTCYVYSYHEKGGISCLK